MCSPISSYIYIKITIRLATTAVFFSSNILSAILSLVSSISDWRGAKIRLSGGGTGEALSLRNICVVGNRFFVQGYSCQLARCGMSSKNTPTSHCADSQHCSTTTGPEVESGYKHVLLQLPLKHMGTEEKRFVMYQAISWSVENFSYHRCGTLQRIWCSLIPCQESSFWSGMQAINKTHNYESTTHFFFSLFDGNYAKANGTEFLCLKIQTWSGLVKTSVHELHILCVLTYQVQSQQF